MQNNQYTINDSEKVSVLCSDCGKEVRISRTRLKNNDCRCHHCVKARKFAHVLPREKLKWSFDPYQEGLQVAGMGVGAEPTSTLVMPF